MYSKIPEISTIGPLTEINLGFISLPTYYTVLSLTYCLTIFWFYKRCETRNLPQKHAMDIGLIVLFAGFIGARIFHVLFEYPEFYFKHPAQIFYFWQGGFVFYGGFIFAYICAFLYARKFQLTFWLWHDTAAPVLAGGYALGRVACFLVGCCYGKVCDLPWGLEVKQVHLHTGVEATLTRHPTQLYATGIELLSLVVLLWYEKTKPKLGNVFLVWVAMHSVGRIVMETFRADPRGGIYLGLSISTIISILLFASASAVFIKRQRGAYL